MVKALFGGCAAAMLLASALPLAADTEIKVDYPFNVEHARPAGQAFTAAKGETIYSEKAIGRPGVFLTERFDAPHYGVTIDPSDPLTAFPFTQTERPFWGKRTSVEMKAHCPDKAGDDIIENSLGKVRRTQCLIDGDGDQRFDQWVTGFARVVERFGTDDTPFGVTAVYDEALSTAPLAYTTRTFMPDQGKEGVVELRYDGVRKEKALLTVVGRFADSATPIYQRQVAFDRPKASATEIEVEHPVLGSEAFRLALGHRPPSEGADIEKRVAAPVQIPMMRIAITQADAKSVTATVVTPLPEWVWFAVPCETKSADPAVGGADSAPKAMCDAVTFRYGMSLVTIAPGAPSQFRRTAITQGVLRSKD